MRESTPGDALTLRLHLEVLLIPPPPLLVFPSEPLVALAVMIHEVYIEKPELMNR